MLKGKTKCQNYASERTSEYLFAMLIHETFLGTMLSQETSGVVRSRWVHRTLTWESQHPSHWFIIQNNPKSGEQPMEPCWMPNLMIRIATLILHGWHGFFAAYLAFAIRFFNLGRDDHAQMGNDGYGYEKRKLSTLKPCWNWLQTFLSEFGACDRCTRWKQYQSVESHLIWFSPWPNKPSFTRWKLKGLVNNICEKWSPTVNDSVATRPWIAAPRCTLEKCSLGFGIMLLTTCQSKTILSNRNTNSASQSWSEVHLNFSISNASRKAGPTGSWEANITTITSHFWWGSLAYPNLEFVKRFWGSCVNPNLNTIGLCLFNTFSNVSSACRTTAPVEDPTIGSLQSNCGSASNPRKHAGARSNPQMVSSRCFFNSYQGKKPKDSQKPHILYYRLFFKIGHQWVYQNQLTKTKNYTRTYSNHWGDHFKQEPL